MFIFKQNMIAHISFLISLAIAFFILGTITARGFGNIASLFSRADIDSAAAQREGGLEIFQNPVVEVYQGRIHAINSAFYFLTGFDEEQLKGILIKKILPDVHSISKWPCRSRLKDAHNNTLTISLNKEQHKGLMLFILNDKRDTYFLSSERRAEIDATITSLSGLLFNSTDMQHSIGPGLELISSFLGGADVRVHTFSNGSFIPFADQNELAEVSYKVRRTSDIPDWELTRETGVFIAPRVHGKALREKLGKNVKSYYLFLLEDGDSILGALDVSFNKIKPLSDEELNVLRIAADILSSTFIRHNIQQRLRSREEVFSMLTETIKEAFIIYTPGKQSYKYLSPAIETLFQIPVLQILDDPVQMHAQFDSDSREKLGAIYNAEKTHKGNENHLFWAHVNGSEKCIECRFYTIGDFTGSEHRIIGIMNDVTHQVHNQQKLEAAAKQEVDIGRRIQKMLLLDEPDNMNPGLDIRALTRPSREIDGDFYNFFYYSMDTIDVVLGDVMGKGIPAALIGAASKSSLLRALAALLLNSRKRAIPNPSEILSFSRDATIDKLIELEQFITLTFLRIQYDFNRFEFVDCGNTPIIHYRKSMEQCFLLKGGNMPVGFSSDEEYISHIVPFETGDIFLLFSDGVSEALNPEGKSFNIDGITDFLCENSELTADLIVHGLEKKLVDFCKRDSFNDDITNLAIKVNNTAVPFIIKEKCFSAGLDQLTELRSFIQMALADGYYNLNDEHSEGQMQFILASNEAFTNIIRHGNIADSSTIQCSIRMHKNWYCLEFIYKGDRFSWLKGQKPAIQQYQETGYGLYLIEKSVESVVYATDGKSTQSILLSSDL